jgi:hypothetical protein
MLKLWRPPGAPRKDETVMTSTGTTRPALASSVTGRALAAAAATLAVTASLAVLAGPAGAVSLNQFANSSVIAAEGPANSLDYHYQTSPGVWTSQQVAGPSTTYSAPSMAHLPSQVVIAAEGPGNSLDFYYQFYGGWRAQQVAGPGTTYSAPSLAILSPSNPSGWMWGIAVEGPGGSLNIYYQNAQTFGTTTWNLQRVAASGTTFSAPSLARVGNSAAVAAEGVFNSLRYYHQTTTGSWFFQNAASHGTTYSAPSLALINTTPVIAAEGPGNSLDFYWRASSGAWNPQQAAGSGSVYSAPSVAHVDSRAAGAYFGIAAEGPGNSLSFYYSSNGIGTPWILKQAAGASTTYSAPSMTQVGDSGLGPFLGIAAEGPTQSLRFYGQMIGLTITWNLQNVAGPGTTFA